MSNTLCPNCGGKGWTGDSLNINPMALFWLLHEKHKCNKKYPELCTLFGQAQALIQAERIKAREEAIDENTSDGYHTFKELYEFRLLYNAHLFNEWAKQGKNDVHKSYKHSDGELAFGGGWFVVVAQLPSGQITNHYENKDWDKFQVEEREVATEWDGHTPADVAKRLLAELDTPKGETK